MGTRSSFDFLRGISVFVLLGFPFGLFAQSSSGAPDPSPSVQTSVQKARSAWGSKDSKGALGPANKALSDAQKANDLPGQAAAYRILALAYGSLSDNVAAADAWKAAEKAWTTTGYLPGRVEALAGRAFILYEVNPLQGRALIDELLNLEKESSPNHLELARAWNAAALGAMATWNYPLAQSLLAPALKAVQETDANSLDAAAIHFNIGLISARSLTKLEAAMESIHHAIQILTNTAPNSLATAAAFHLLGKSYDLTGNAEQAHVVGAKARSILRTLAETDVDAVLETHSFGTAPFVVAETGPKPGRPLDIVLLHGNDHEEADSQTKKKSKDEDQSQNERIIEQMSRVFQTMPYGHFQSALRSRMWESRSQNKQTSFSFAMMLPGFSKMQKEMKEAEVGRHIDELVGNIDPSEPVVMAPEPNPVLKTPELPMSKNGESPSQSGKTEEPQASPQKKKDGWLKRNLPIPKGIPGVGGILGVGGNANEALQRAEQVQQTATSINQMDEAARKMSQFRTNMQASMDQMMASLIYSNWPQSRVSVFEGKPGIFLFGPSDGIPTKSLKGDQLRTITTFLPQMVPMMIHKMAAPGMQKQGRLDALWEILEDYKGVGSARRAAEHDFMNRAGGGAEASSMMNDFRQDYAADERVLATLLRKESAELDVWQAELSNPGDVAEARSKLAEVQKNLSEAFARSRDRTEQHQVSNQKLSDLKGGKPPSRISAAEAASSLPEGTIWISVGSENNECFIFLLDRAEKNPRLSFHRVPFDPLTIRYFQTLVSDKKASKEDLVKLGRMFFQNMFPQGKMREAVLSAKRILIAPDGVIWDLPFSALVMNETGEPRFLGLEKTLTYETSFQAFRHAQSVSPSAQKNSLEVFGDIVFKSAPGTAYELMDLRRLPPLPGARLEAEQVAKIYGSVPRTQSDASETAVQNALQNASVIHVATHGLNLADLVSPRDLPMQFIRQVGFAGLWLSPATGDDALLQAWEMGVGKSTSAELVVLSACETGRTKFIGRPPPEIPEALLAAGAKSIIACHWRVADQSTAELMTSFHRELKAGTHKDEALRRAALELQSKPATSHPFYWAPFLLFGDPDTH